MATEAASSADVQRITFLAPNSRGPRTSKKQACNKTLHDLRKEPNVPGRGHDCGGQAGSGDSTRMGSALVRGEAGHDDVFQPAVARLLDSLRRRSPWLRVSFGTCGLLFEP